MAGFNLEPSNNSGILSSAVVTISTAGTAASPAGATGTFIRVYKLFLVAGGVTNLTFADGATTLAGPLPFATNGSITLDMDGTPWFSTSKGNAFNIQSSGTGVTVDGVIYYTQANY
jgi:hypothetical protein